MLYKKLILYLYKKSLECIKNFHYKYNNKIVANLHLDFKNMNYLCPLLFNNFYSRLIFYDPVVEIHYYDLLTVQCLIQ